VWVNVGEEEDVSVFRRAELVVCVGVRIGVLQKATVEGCAWRRGLGWRVGMMKKE
jgi:hypothetical protein